MERSRCDDRGNRYGAAKATSLLPGSRVDERTQKVERLEDANEGKRDEDDKKPAAEAHHHRSPSEAAQQLSHGIHFAVERLAPEEFPAFVKANDSTLTFPEKLMLMLVHIERLCAKSGRPFDKESVSWTIDGKSFVIRDQDVFCSVWVPLFFGKTKFPSFTRKLYRWGFRKISPRIFHSEKGSIIVFGNENFQRDDMSLLSHMSSTTASKMRKKGKDERRDSDISTSGADCASVPVRLQMHADTHEIREVQARQPYQSRDLPMTRATSNFEPLTHSDLSSSQIYGVDFQPGSAALAMAASLQLSATLSRVPNRVDNTSRMLPPSSVTQQLNGQTIEEILQQLQGHYNPASRQPVQQQIDIQALNQLLRRDHSDQEQERLAAIAEMFLRYQQRPPPRLQDFHFYMTKRYSLFLIDSPV